MNIYGINQMRRFVKAREARNKIGAALTRAYPGIKWLVDVNSEGGICTIAVPAISTEYGMVLHLSRPMEELEREAVRKGGELLERFRLSRDRIAHPTFGHIPRNIKGEAVGAAKGEL